MNYNEWAETFRPIPNHLTGGSSFDGTMFETFGDELDFVRQQEPSKVWTFVSGDGDAIVAGYSLVNRVGYFVTEMPFGDDTTEVEL